MRKLLVFIFIFIGVMANAQTLRQFEGTASIYFSSGSGPTYSIRAFYNDQLSYYSSDSAQVGDILYVLNGGACARLRVSVVRSKTGGILDIDVFDIDGVMSAPPSGVGGITRETNVKGLPMYMIGISQSLRTCVGSHLAIKSDTLDTSLAIIDSTVIRNDSIFLAVAPDEFYVGPASSSSVGVDSIQYVRDTMSLSPQTGDQFVNSTKDTSGVYSSDRWLLSIGGSGSSVVVQQGPTPPYGLVTPTGIGSTYIDTVQNKAYTAYGPLNTSWAKQETVSYYDTKSDIAATYHSVGDIIITSGFAVLNDVGKGAVYRVFADSVGGFENEGNAVIELSSSNYAILQPTDTYGYKPEWFGAIPDDSQPDSTAFDACMQWIKQPSVSSKMEIGPGIFNDPLLRIYRINGSTYDFITATVSGNVSTYAGNSAIGRNTVFRFNNQSAGIFIQAGRSVLIENIHFEGSSTAPFFDQDSLIHFVEADWQRHHAADFNNPHAGVVIDPFRVTGVEYPGLAPFYNYGVKYSSAVTVRNSSFEKLDQAVGELGNLNGDNIKIENINASRLRRFYTTLSTQSREGIVENVYLLFAQSIYENAGVGSLPSTTNMSGAGFIKQVFDIASVASVVLLADCSFESLWRIGRAQGGVKTISGTSFKFSTVETLGAPLTVYDDLSGSTTFQGCQFTYFSNCTIKPLFPFDAAVNFIGCGFEGGLPYSNKLASTGAGVFDMDNSVLGCVDGSVISIKKNIVPSKGAMMMGPAKFTSKSETFNYEEQTTMLASIYELDFITTANIHVTSGASGFFTLTDPLRNVMVGDGLAVNTDIDNGVGDDKPGGLGYVDRVSNDTVYIEKMPYGFPTGSSYSIYVPRKNVPIVNVYGDLVSGQDTIKNIIGDASWWQTNGIIGANIDMPQFPDGTFIVEYSVSGNWIRASKTTAFNMTRRKVETVRYHKNIWSDGTFPPSTYIGAGDVIYNWNGLTSVGWTRGVCTVGGLIGDGTTTILYDALVEGSTSTGDIPIWNNTTKRYEPGTVNVYVDTVAYIFNQNYTISPVSLAANNLMSFTSRVNSSSTEDNTITIPAPIAGYANKRIVVYSDDLDNSSTDSYDTEVSATTIYLGNNNIGATYVLAGGETIELICLLRDGSYIWEILSRRFGQGTSASFSNTSQTILTERGGVYRFQNGAGNHTADTLDVSDLEPGDEIKVQFFSTTKRLGTKSLKLSSGTFTWDGISGLDSIFIDHGAQDLTLAWTGTNMVAHGNKIYQGYGGWANYQDTTQTEAAPLVLTAGDTMTIFINKDLVNESQLPLDLDSLYSEVDSTILGMAGDAYQLTFEYTAKQKSASKTTLTTFFDIGGGIPPFYRASSTMNDGNNAVFPNNKSTMYYTLDTWESNGGKVKVAANQNVELYDMRFVITRLHKAR